MKIADVKKKAKERRVNVSGMNNANMVRAIQIAEGNFPCFGTATEYCNQVDCCWREDCLPQKTCCGSKFSL